MAHLATRRFNYWAQLGILTACCGIGLIIGGILSFIPLLGKFSFNQLLGGSSTDLLKNLMQPQNAGILRWMQFISTFFLFFLPPVMYAWFCHKKPFLHLGYVPGITVGQIVFMIAIMLVALPVVSLLQDVTELYPWKPAMLLKFKEAEEAYNKQVTAIARMDNFWDYLISVLVIAFLPAMFEETLFRGGIQNLLTRWIKAPVLAIVITSIIFSAIHGSYLGFLSRFALGFILGWVYYRTGNLWLNIIGHFFNNAFAISVLYFSTAPGQKIDPAKMDERFPFWIGIVSLLLVIILFVLFERLFKKAIDQPGQEVLIPYTDYNNPFNDEPPR